MGLWNKDCSSRLTGATSERTIKVGACHRYQHLQSISQGREDQANTEPSLPTTGAALNCISEECLRSTFLFEALVAKTGVFMPLKIPQHKKIRHCCQNRARAGKNQTCWSPSAQQSEQLCNISLSASSAHTDDALTDSSLQED